MTNIIYAPDDEIFQPSLYSQEYPPSTQCQLSFGKAKYCSRDFCYHHGKTQRAIDCERIKKLGIPKSPPWLFVGNIGFVISPNLATHIRETFFRKLKKHDPKMGILWRWHWVDQKPHLNMTSITILTGNEKLFLDAWEETLRQFSHPYPKATRSKAERVKDYIAWTVYLFKANEDLPSKEAPPRMPKGRWSYWGYDPSYKANLISEENRWVDIHTLF